MNETDLFVRHSNERIASLETKVADLRDDQQKIIEKLDELLALKNRGLGAFWFVSAIFGTSLLGAMTLVLQWIKK